MKPKIDLDGNLDGFLLETYAEAYEALETLTALSLTSEEYSHTDHPYAPVIGETAVMLAMQDHENLQQLSINADIEPLRQSPVKALKYPLQVSVFTGKLVAAAEFHFQTQHYHFDSNTSAGVR